MDRNGAQGNMSGQPDSTSQPGMLATGKPSARRSSGRSPTQATDERSPQPDDSTRSAITPTKSGSDSSSSSSTSAACSVADCATAATTRGLCSRHYQRLLKTGDPLGTKPGRWDGYARPTCSAPGCDSPAHAHGLCPTHVKRAERHGDVHGGRRHPATGATIADRLAVLVTRRGADECWPWNAATLPTGYGQLTFMGERMYAHRAAWEAANGPVPPGLVIDHRCHNDDPSCPGGACAHRRCCNPAHLEAVTSDLNLRRSRLRRNVSEGES